MKQPYFGVDIARKDAHHAKKPLSIGWIGWGKTADN